MFSRLLVFFSLSLPSLAQTATFPWIQQLGGSQGQSIVGMSTDAQGNIYVAGSTSSLDFPVKSALQPHPGGAGVYRIDGPGPQFQGLYSAPFSGVSQMVADPRDAQSLYAVSGQTIFRTTDGGGSWAALPRFDAAVTGLAIDPSAGAALYVATRGKGVFKSVDSGSSWAAINNGIGAYTDGSLNVYGIWLDPAQPSVVFTSTYPGLARSTDGGATWQTQTQFDPYHGVFDMAFDPHTPGLVYVATLANLQKSSDDGLTWTTLPPPVVNYSGHFVLVDPKTAAVYTAGPYGGLFVSSDQGATWTNRAPNSTAPTGPLGADRVTGALYAVTSGKLIVSTDGFQTSTPVGPASGGILSMAVAGTRVFAGAQSSADVFVAKFDPLGNPVYATYFGGVGADQAVGMAVDSAGSVYVTGSTDSPDFPVSDGAFAQTGRSFVFKLNPDGSLGYSTYFAGGQSHPNAIAVDSSGHAYITGWTQGNLPVTAGAYQPSLQGVNPCCSIIGPGLPPVINAFLTAFNPDGGSLLFSTYVGKQSAFAQTLTLAPDGNLILAGGSALWRIQGDGAALLNSGTLPGVIWSLIVNPGGNIFAGGQAMTTNPPFPATAGAFQTSVANVPFLPGTSANISDGDGFVTKLDSQFHVLTSTLLGGESQDEVIALALAANGDVIAGGATYSKAFPLRGPAQGSFFAPTGFVTEFTPDLSDIVFSTYTGDARKFVVTALAPAADGGVLFAGDTQNPPAYVGSAFFNPPGAIQPDASVQGFVVKSGLKPSALRIERVVNAASQLGVPLTPGGTFQVQGGSFATDAVLLVNGAALPLLAQTRVALTAMLPVDLGAPGAAQIVVESGGARSEVFLAAVDSMAPGVFSVDGSGVGQGYIRNQDGTLNSPANPVKEGSPITIFATGVGPIRNDGGYAVTDTRVDVTIDGFYANGIAATLGPVADLPGDVYQISVYVPRPSDFADVNPNLKNFVMPPLVAVSLNIGGARSQGGLALSVSH